MQRGGAWFLVVVAIGAVVAAVVALARQDGAIMSRSRPSPFEDVVTAVARILAAEPWRGEWT